MYNKYMRRLFVITSIIALFSILSLSMIIRADEYDDITKQLNDLKQSLNSSQQATKNNEQNLSNLNKQLDGIKYKVSLLQTEINKKEKEVRDGEEALNYQKTILNKRTISYYKNLNNDSFSLLTALISDSFTKSVQGFFYQKSLIDDDRKTILKVIAYIKEIADKKASLEKENIKLLAIKKEVDSQSQFLAGEVAKSKKFENELQSKIAVLSAKQEQIIAQRQGSLNIPHSASTSQGGCSDDRDTDPGFSPRFAFFTFGVPNRVGLNQYGAYGRAKANQSAEDILQAYYPGVTLKKDYDTSATVNVEGYGSYNVEDYVKRIYEMPDSWTANDNAALKAQAVAARSYGLAHRNSICSTDSCQVFKPEAKGGNWNNAAEATRGWVLVDGGGNPVSAQYSSTHGGYILNLNKFDGEGGNPSNFDDLKNRAYDKESPWFYCDWGYRAQYNKTAWLRSEEVADIVNALMLAKADSGTIEHLYQPDTPPAGTDTWSQERVKTELRNRNITPYSSVSNISTDSDLNSGRSSNVRVSGDAGDKSFNPDEFKGYFNVRAPANIFIAGPLFNVERK
jgi:peptidoglycan hydrolase CwlO-like protein